MRLHPLLAPEERVVVRRWTRRTLGAWIAIVIATLSLSMFGHDRAHLARAEARTLSAECAREDVKAVAWIDEQTQQRTIAPPLLAEAALRVLRARNTCLHGRVAVALEAYESALRFADPARAPPERQADAGK
jgi:hypothetical protein